MSRRRLDLGARGEDMAANWYADQGYIVLARNWRSRNGELDLILRQQGTVVFCEVKTRSSAAFGMPAEAVTWDKQQRIRRLAYQWLAQASIRPRELRFDVASILAGEIEVIEAAF